MSQRFIKFIPGPEEEFLSTKPIAFTLLSLVAKRARRESGLADGLDPGECYIGDHKSIGATRQEYRTALKLLVTRKHFKILETCRTRQKSTTGTTTIGTKVKLLSSNVWDINLEETNHRSNHCPTTDQPPTNHEQERRRTNQEGIKKGTIVKEKEEKIVRPSFRSPPSYQEDLKHLNELAIAMRWDIDSKDFGIWLKKYGREMIDKHLVEMDKQKYKVVNHARWMQSALDRNFIGQKENISKNFEFAKEFKKQNNWISLRITKKYCCDEDTQKDFLFFLPPEQFREALFQGYKTKEHIG